MLIRIAQQVDELNRSMSDVLLRQNTLDVHVGNLIAAQTSVDANARERAYTNGVHDPGVGEHTSGLRRSTTSPDWKALRHRKMYLETVPTYDGKAASWNGFITKLRLALDEVYEWAPLYLRMSEGLESSPTRQQLMSWIEQRDIGYDREDMIEFGKDLWSVLSNRTEAGTNPASVVNRVMDSEVGWMRGPVALHEIQREGLGRAVNRRAELNRRVHTPTAVKKWDEVPSAINA